MVVTKHDYLDLPDRLLQNIEAAVPATTIWTEDDMYQARAHDSQWLTTCKAQVDGIRWLVKAKPPDKTQSSDKTP